MKNPWKPFLLVITSVGLFCPSGLGQEKPRVAVFSGPLATIQNSPPLVTSNKARTAAGLPLTRGPEGRVLRGDHLAPQRLAAPVTVLVEQFSAHPLEKDAAHLYHPPDGFVDAQGQFHQARQSPQDKPVYRVTLQPEDGLYLLPYMARQTNGQPWDGFCTFPGAPPEQCRQPFYPDASRIFEEIDRGLAGRDRSGGGNMLGRRADYDFYRAVPSGGYNRGLPETERTDVGKGDIAPEVLGEDYYPYTPDYFRRETQRRDLAKATNIVQRALRSGIYSGAVWLEASPTVQDTVFWLGLLVDTTVPITANAAQRAHGSIGVDGDRNIIDSVDYIVSRAWADAKGRDVIGAVLIQDEQIFMARQVEKQDARPGGYRAAGDGGIVGTTGEPGPVTVWFLPIRQQTWRSAVNLSRLPAQVEGVRKGPDGPELIPVQIKDAEGWLRGEAIPKVTVVRYDPWSKDSPTNSPDEEVEVQARIQANLEQQPLAGLVVEGTTPYGNFRQSLVSALEHATYNGMPVVRVSRGDEGGMLEENTENLTIEGSNLTTAKARLLLMATLMKLGSLPPAADPHHPTASEKQAILAKLNQYQEVFNTH